MSHDHPARSRGAAAASRAFDPRGLTLARKLRGMRKNELARSVGVTPAALSQYELGQSRPSPDTLARLALALGVPVSFFLLGAPAASQPERRSFPQPPRDHAPGTRAGTRLRAPCLAPDERHRATRRASSLRTSPPDSCAEPGSGGIEEAARQTRAAMGISSGPVPHVVRLLEAHGTVVLLLPVMSRRVDAFSHWYGSRPFVFLNPAKDDKARSRFDGAHELGHLILHHDAEPGNRVVENQAQDFAAEFLIPRDEIADELPRRLDWDRLHQAKRRWGVSLKALVYRALKLGLIGESTYRSGMIMLAQWGDPEPGPLGPKGKPDPA